jgi:uncharacterized membrane protein YdfJ with MMPL/SSD domain
LAPTGVGSGSRSGPVDDRVGVAAPQAQPGLLVQGFGPGTNGPLVVALQLVDPAGQRTVTALRTDLARRPDVAFVSPAQYSPGGSAAVLTVIPRTSPQDSRTSTLVRDLRDTVVPQVTARTGVTALIGGRVAVLLDATLVRVVATPAVLQLTTRANWWFPRRLGRAIPDFLTETSSGEKGSIEARRTAARLTEERTS